MRLHSARRLFGRKMRALEDLECWVVIGQLTNSPALIGRSEGVSIRMAHATNDIPQVKQESTLYSTDTACGMDDI